MEVNDFEILLIDFIKYKKLVFNIAIKMEKNWEDNRYRWLQVYCHLHNEKVTIYDVILFALPAVLKHEKTSPIIGRPLCLGNQHIANLTSRSSATCLVMIGRCSISWSNIGRFHIGNWVYNNVA